MMRQGDRSSTTWESSLMLVQGPRPCFEAHMRNLPDFLNHNAYCSGKKTSAEGYDTSIECTEFSSKKCASFVGMARQV